MKFFITWLLCITGIFAFAQNNDIFNGGPGDGWNRTNYQQASNNIFNGGNGDGWTITAYAQSSNNIFNGGNGDGWDKTSFAQPGNAIFNGGIGDGWDKTSFTQAGNAIFGGGAGDGWDKTSFAQPGNNIFFGGIGDGWASTYRPQGPLPVTFEYFTAEKIQQTASLLKWKTSQEVNSARFEIERSEDAISFTKIGSVAAAGNSAIPLLYNFTDNAPVTGLNYYRIKQIDIDGRATYTPARVLRFDELNARNVQYYPNPTTGPMKIQMSSSPKEPTVVNIFNASGMVVSQLKVPANNGIIIPVDLSPYAKGIYFIQVKTNGVNSTQKVILQ